MKDLIPFNYQGKQVRTIMITGEPWFVAKDICDILDLDDVRRAVERLDDDERSLTPVIDALGREQEMWVVNEAGLYGMVLGSKKPEAKLFKRWVTHDVLPTIRKTGGYNNLPQTLPEALRAYADEVECRLLAEAKVKELQPKADFFDAVADSKTAIEMAAAAKVLSIKGIGRNNLFEMLRKHGILMQNNQPYQEFVDRGYFRVIEQKFTKPDGSTNISIKTLVYQKGLDHIRRLLAKGV